MIKKSIFDEHWQQAKHDHIGQRYEIVEHGWEQHVLVDHQKNLVYRFPRNKNAKEKLDDEVGVLNELKKVDFNVSIPIIHVHNDDFSLYTYIEGQVIDEALVGKLTDEEASKIGEALGEFLAILHSVDPQIAKDKKTKQTQSLYDYYKARIDYGKDSDFYDHSKQLLEIIENNQTDEVIVHGDLHGLNMVINSENKELVGVIDFSELELGNRYQDFRKIFMTDVRFLAPALNAYHLKTGYRLNQEVILAWAYVNEWANIAYYTGNEAHPTYVRAKKHLQRWGEL